jgi:hypothetical protein
MFKLTMTVMSSVFLGLFFGTVGKAESGTEPSVLTPSQSSAIQHMIDSSLGNRLNFIVEKLDDLERRIKGDQSWSASDKDYKDYKDKDYKDKDYKDKDYKDKDYKDYSCPGPLCQPEPARDHEKGSPCWPSTCEAHDKSPCWPSTCGLLRDRGSPCWPSGCGDKQWSCYGSHPCRYERPRRVDIHIYKHVYIHKHIYKHVYWHPPYIPCWDECSW